MKYLKKTFRWFGPDFGVSLPEIKQAGATGIVSACHQFKIGEEWTLQAIKNLKNTIESNNLEWSVVESVGIHNSIKNGYSDRDNYIENYVKTLKNLSDSGINTVCYNFMPLIDWTRTNLSYSLPDKSISLEFNPLAAVAFDLFILKRASIYEPEIESRAKLYFEKLSEAEKISLRDSILAGLPGSKKGIDINEFKKLLEDTSKLNKDDLFTNFSYFLKAIIPEAEKYGIKMALHPDDPPTSVFGVPRIASNLEDYKKIINIYNSTSNGITFCSGSLGADDQNNLVHFIEQMGEKIHFIHLRNVIRREDGSFYESNHLDGSIDMVKLMNAIINEQEKRHKSSGEVEIPIRPDHGLVILDDFQKREEFYPGYSLIGRTKGLSELTGLEIGLRSLKEIN